MLKKISGFTFIRNGVMLGYPFVESIKSLLPLVDELVIAAGNSNDATLEKLSKINSEKIRIVNTVWDDTKRSGGAVLAEQTNIALQNCKYEWCVYLQADEVLHEQDYNTIFSEIQNADSNVEGLVFDWKHFYGSYDFIGVGRQWYRYEIRAFKNTGSVVSYRDAQGFRTKNKQGELVKLNCKKIDATIYHYGWVRHPKEQTRKQKAFYKLYNEQDLTISDEAMFDYTNCYEVEKYFGSHPKQMKSRIAGSKNWTQNFDPTKLQKKNIKITLSDWLEKKTGLRIGEYKNFRLLKN